MELPPKTGHVLAILLIAALTLSVLVFFFWPSPENTSETADPEKNREEARGGFETTLKTKTGGAIVTRDFLSQGSPGNQQGDQVLYEDKDYRIVSVGYDRSFIISFFTIPQTRIRNEAEERLVSLLGVDKNSLCDLNITTSVPNDVDPLLSGVNFGISFCADGVAIPEK